MSRERHTIVRVRLIAIDPPFQPEHHVTFGLQDKRAGVDAVAATKTTAFTTEIEIINGGGANPDFRGDHVHGKKGDRFLYLSWGTPDHDEPFAMFARAKIKLADLPTELLEADSTKSVECQVQATDSRGRPASGTLKHPDVTWHPRS